MLLCGSASAGGSNRYLAISGPTPIRFRAIVPEYDPGKVLAPLDMGFGAVTNDISNTVEKQITVETTPVQMDFSVATEAAPVEETTTERPTTNLETTVIHPPAESAAVEIKPGQSQITPQMLLRYFKQDQTTGASKEVPMPLEFTPPTPTTAPAGNKSSAVYSTPDAR